VDHLLDMSPGATGAQNAPPPGSLATPGAAVTDLLLNGHPSGLPLGTFAAVALPLAPPSPRVRDGAVHRAAREGRMRACTHPGCAYATDQGAARLATHARTHLDARPFACAEPGCAKRFKTKEHLRQHAVAHVTTREFRCDRPLCVQTNHAPFKSAAELKLHHRRVHTLDAAERRELRHLEKIRVVEAALAESRRDGETLRAAADALKGALEELSGLRRPRTGFATDAARRATATSATDPSPSDPSPSPEESLPGKEKKQKKPYTLSASRALRVATQTAEAARRAWRTECEAARGGAVTKKRRTG
jgi:hypothetical protein